MKSQVRSKKLIIVLCLTCAALLVLVLPSCVRGDINQAKEYLKKGDKAMGNAEVEDSEFLHEIDEQFQKALALTESYSGEPDFPIMMQEQLMKANELTQDYQHIQTGYYGEAWTAYGSIDKLQGVDDYKSYADTRIEEIDLREGNISKTLDFLHNSVNECATPDFCPDEWSIEYQNYKKWMDENIKAADELAEKAEKIKADKNL